ncbi:hypothetical protein DMZ43_02420 [Meridianimaribacter sp. CL38]|uniref:hypothetical protein n=1 Tax=Meridianimaribacter sp. CL38 TaxID=2213021 RepID=UPI00103A1076|nr:hypothetical protein [Meridianimaribacter sp. CL38]TBV27918.1 hypothetical protein DMZ43_02420 [Meridianimaribacter sp. CL38]
MKNQTNNNDDCSIISEKIRIELKQKSINSRINHPFTKKELWGAFRGAYKSLFEVKFAYTDEYLKNNWAVIFNYFLHDLNFYKSSNLFQDEVVPMYNKGLFIAGPVGVGKTRIMKCFEEIFKKYPPHRFKTVSVDDVVQEFEGLTCPNDKKEFFKKYSTGVILFDDLHSEKIANNYGKTNVMLRIIMNRERNNCKTHFTMNPITGFEKLPKENLLQLEDFYDARVADRVFGMCNYITINGKSKRM